MNVAIYPSLLALADRKGEWASEIARVESFSSGIHFDIGDGDFVPSRMLDPADVALVETELPIDVHLMVQRPSEYFEKILSFPGVTAVAFHVECQEDIHEHIQCLHNAGKKVGLAILDATPPDYLDQYLLEIDYILVMTVKGGYSGTPFIPEMLPKITEIHNKNPGLPIVVDGGINQETLSLCIDAGATGAVMSSAIFGGGDRGWIERLVNNK